MGQFLLAALGVLMDIPSKSVSDRSEVLLQMVMEHLAAVSYRDLPESCVERAKDVMIDISGCLLSGLTLSRSKVICRMAESWSSSTESSIPGNAHGSAAPFAAFAMAFMARAFDFGVGGSSALGPAKPPVHISETLVPVALATGEKRKASGQELITALVAGENIAGRLAASLNFRLPLDCRGTVNTIGAAVVAGKLLQLSPRAFEHALFIALHQVGGVKQGTVFNLGQGFSAMFGTMAAELAAQGIQGVDEPVKEGRELLDTFSSGFDAETFFRDWGTTFHTSVSFKPYPCCRATHSTIECVLDLLAQGLRVENLQSAVIHISPWAMAHLVGRPFKLRENYQADAIFSLQYAAASAMLRGGCRLEYYTDACVADPRIMELVRRIHLTSEGWPRYPGEPKLSAFVEACSTDGTRFTAYRQMPRGHELEGEPLSSEEKKDKFMANLRMNAQYSEREAEELYAALKHLEQMEDVSRLSALFKG